MGDLNRLNFPQRNMKVFQEETGYQIMYSKMDKG